MNQRDILSGLHRLQTLVEGWHEGKVPTVERDLALEELRRIYEALRFAAAESAQEVAKMPAQEVTAEEPTQEAQEVAVEQVEEAKETPEQEVTETPAQEPAEEVVEEPAEVEVPQDVADTQQNSTEIEEAPQEVAEVEVPQEESAAQPDDREIILPRQANRRVIMSLYGDAPQQPQAQQPQTVAPEPQPSEATATTAPAQPQQPTVAPTDEGKVLGDVINADDKRLCDTISRPKDIAASTPVTSLRQAIGINDRFLLIRDLFGGDEAEYERAITALDAFDNQDDCMVYIIEHYAWRSDAEGARLIIDLIGRKFGK